MSADEQQEIAERYTDPDRGFAIPSGGDYRRWAALDAGIDPDSLTCSVCGVSRTLDAMRIVAGFVNENGDALPPLAFCNDHRDWPEQNPRQIPPKA